MIFVVGYEVYLWECYKAKLNGDWETERTGVMAGSWTGKVKGVLSLVVIGSSGVGWWVATVWVVY